MKEEERQKRLMQPISRQHDGRSIYSVTNNSETLQSKDVDRKRRTGQLWMNNFSANPTPVHRNDKYAHVKNKVVNRWSKRNRKNVLAYSLLDKSIDNTISLLESARRHERESKERCKR